MNKFLQNSIIIALAGVAALCIVISQGCSKDSETYVSNLSDDENIIRMKILSEIRKTIYYASPMEDVQVMLLPEAEVFTACKSEYVSGCAYGDVIFVVDSNMISFCNVLAHEFMHIALYYTYGDPDTQHTKKYEMYTLPSDICKKIGEL